MILDDAHRKYLTEKRISCDEKHTEHLVALRLRFRYRDSEGTDAAPDMPTQLQDVFRLGPWVVEPQRGLITGPQSQSLHLEPKVMDVLVCLARHAPALVSREELLNTVWGRHIGSDESLTRAIGELRRALDDTSGHPRYVETVPKRGYRLMTAVQTSAGTHERSRMRHLWRVVVPGSIAMALLAAVFFRWNTGPGDDANQPDANRPLAPSIAVLPFENNSAIDADSYFVNGIHDAIVTQLANLSVFDRVISRISTERYRDSRISSFQIGRDLRVDSILKGRVQRSGDRVRVNAQLIDAESDTIMWANSYDRSLSAENIFHIQSEIAEAVAGALHSALTLDETRILAATPTHNLAAYDSYLRGRQSMSVRTVERLAHARTLFEQAIALDDQFALAHSALAETICLLVLYGGLSEDAYTFAEASARRALALNPDLGAVHAALGFVHWRRHRFIRSELGAAESHYQRAIELAPKYVPAYQWYALLLLDTMRHDQAIDLLRQAIELDPFNPLLHAELGEAFAWAGEKDSAVNSLMRALELDPEHAFTMRVLGSYYLAYGEPAEAIKWLRRALAIDPSNVAATARMVSAYLSLGAQEEAEFWYQRLEEMPDTFWQKLYGYLIEFSRGQDEQGFRIAEQWLAENPECAACLEVVAWHLTANGAVEPALEYVEKYRPELLNAPRQSVNQQNLYLVAPVARALMQAGRHEEADKLLHAGLAEAVDIPRLLLGERGSGIEDVRMLALLGRNEEAIAAFRVATQQGWRIRHPGLETQLLDLLENEPAFVEILQEVESNIAREHSTLIDMEKNGELPPIPP